MKGIYWEVCGILGPRVVFACSYLVLLLYFAHILGGHTCRETSCFLGGLYFNVANIDIKVILMKV